MLSARFTQISRSRFAVKQSGVFSGVTKRWVSQLNFVKTPGYTVENEKVLPFAPESKDRDLLHHSIQKVLDTEDTDKDIPIVINGERIYASHRDSDDSGVFTQNSPSSHSTVLANVASAQASDMATAIEGSLKAKKHWMSLPFHTRADVFLKAADLLSTKYRYEMLAATMLGQGKNVYQAEIDCIAELCDFFRFNVKYAEELYSSQPKQHATGVWNWAEYRPLEGFVYAITPFNFTAIAGNLVGAPALMGNTVVWKPSASSVLSNYLLYQILEEAGLPEGVVQFLPTTDAAGVSEVALNDSTLSAVHFTGSTAVFKDIDKKVSQNIDVYRDYPRLVGETGGKNFHLIHGSTKNVRHAALSTLRGAFEYQGQKCSATSRVYVARSVFQEFMANLVQETEKVATTSLGNCNTISGMSNFMGPVIHRQSFDKLKGIIDKAKNDSEVELVFGGKYNDETGYFVSPSVYLVKNLDHHMLKDEYFGPILGIYVFDDAQYDNIVDHLAVSSNYALTGSLFAGDVGVIADTSDKLLYAAGNFYVNDKCTGAVVGQQWFGGSRMSGTNDKSGSGSILTRFVSVRNVKQNHTEIADWRYESNF